MLCGQQQSSTTVVHNHAVPMGCGVEAAASGVVVSPGGMNKVMQRHKAYKQSSVNLQFAGHTVIMKMCVGACNRRCMQFTSRSN